MVCIERNSSLKSQLKKIFGPNFKYCETADNHQSLCG